jgi:aspartate-semialdehyde dehydrogenase
MTQTGTSAEITTRCIETVDRSEPAPLELADIMPGATRQRLTAELAEPVRASLVGKTIAVVGATGAVGLEALALLTELGVPNDRIIASGSARSVGNQIFSGGENFRVLPVAAVERADIAVLATPAEVSSRIAPALAACGVLVSDNSSALRRSAPLVIPEINPRAAKAEDRIIATPNCTTTIALTGLAGVLHEFSCDGIEITSYQAVSGAGLTAMQSLIDESRDIVQGRPTKPRWLDHPVAFNVFPHESELDTTTGQCAEELKFAGEASRILAGTPSRFVATCLRVPVLRSHTVVARLEISEQPSPDEVAARIATTPSVEVLEKEHTSAAAAGSCNVLVSRIRVEPNAKYGGSVIRMIISSDQLLKGAAWNALQNASLLLTKHS